MTKIVSLYKKACALTMDCFIEKAPSPFAFYHIPYFTDPSVTFNHLYQSTISNQNLLNLEEFIKQKTKLKQVPLKLIIENKSARIKLEKNLIKKGYLKLGDINVNFWSSPIKFIIPEGHSFRIGHFLDSNLYKDHAYIQKKVFKSDDKILKKIKRMSKDMQVNPLLIVIYNKKGDPIGSGGATIVENICWLFAGAILPRYQGKGLWRCLTGLRQTTSKTMGAKYWFLETANPKIAPKFDLQFTYSLLSKPLNLSRSKNGSTKI